MPVFVLLGRANGSLAFDKFSAAGLTPFAVGLVFLLAVAGFGAKAGVVPFHVWLPEAHPVAPSPVSALLSGVLIKFGIYGLVRVISFLGPPPVWWAWVLIGLGLVSGVWGILNAIVQRDLKRLLAYSSVENIGIIVLGLGLGAYGRHTGSTPMAVPGTMLRSAILAGNSKSAASRLTVISRFATLSNIKPKKALTSPQAAHG